MTDPFDRDAYWESVVEQIQDLVQAKEENKDNGKQEPEKG